MTKLYRILLRLFLPTGWLIALCTVTWTVIALQDGELPFGFDLGGPRWLRFGGTVACALITVAGVWLLTQRFRLDVSGTDSETRRRADELRNQGLGLSEIAERLGDEGRLAPRDYRWTARHVRNLVGERPVLPEREADRESGREVPR